MAQTIGDGGTRPTPKQRKKIKRSGRNGQDMGIFEDTRDRRPKAVKTVVRRKPVKKYNR